MITINGLKRHIKRRLKQGKCMGFLGLVENKELSPEVERLFICEGYNGYIGYDWVNGNSKLQDLVKEVDKEEGK